MQHYFANMSKQNKWVGVAFRKGTMSDPYDMLVMSGTMGPYVHCELLLGEGSKADAFSSFNNETVKTGFCRSFSKYDDKDWNILAFPVSDTHNAKLLSLQLLDLNVPYNSRDLWQCCMKALLPYETEVDCDTPTQWRDKGVFCSQMCLLFLRMMARKGDMQASDTLKGHLENVHSRGCSPNMLHAILSQFFVPVM